jgi:hypothetical protein
MSIWIFIAEVAFEFILGLDFLHTYDTSVVLGRHTLRLGNEELLLSRSRAMLQSFRLEVAGDKTGTARCEKVIMARLESPLGVEDGLIEPRPEAHIPGWISIKPG